MKKYILWDFDCTLGYRDGKWTQTLNDLLKANHNNIPYDTIKPFMQTGLPWHEFEKSHKELFRGLSWWEYVEKYLTSVLDRLGVHKSKHIASQFRSHYLDLKYWHLYDDTCKTLEELSAMGYTHIIASNHVPELPELVEQLGIGQYFEKIYSSANMQYDKPNIHFFREILGDLEKDSDIIMIGDDYNSDIRGGKHSGINKAILVHNPNQMRYEFSCNNLEEIPALIQECEKTE